MNLEKEAVSMGIIRAAAHAVGGGLADQWLEVIDPEHMQGKSLMPSIQAVRCLAWRTVKLVRA